MTTRCGAADVPRRLPAIRVVPGHEPSLEPAAASLRTRRGPAILSRHRPQGDLHGPDRTHRRTDPGPPPADPSVLYPLAQGTLPVEAIQEYTRQYYAFESAFPRLLSAIHSRTDDPVVRQSILDNLWDEEHGEVNHAELWLRFAEGMGVEREDVRGAEANDGTQALIDDLLGPGHRWLAGRRHRGDVRLRGSGPRGRGREDQGAPRPVWHRRRSDAGVFHGPLHPGPRALRRRAGRDPAHDHDRVRPRRRWRPPRAALDAWWGFLDAVNV